MKKLIMTGVVFSLLLGIAPFFSGIDMFGSNLRALSESVTTICAWSPSETCVMEDEWGKDKFKDFMPADETKEKGEGTPEETPGN